MTQETHDSTNNPHTDSALLQVLSDLLLKDFNLSLLFPNEIGENCSKALSPAISALLQQGDHFYDQQNYDHALKTYCQAALLDNFNGDAWDGVVCSLYAVKQFEVADLCDNYGTLFAPTHDHLWCAGGYVSWKLQNYHHAIRRFQKAIALNPSMDQAYLGWGHVLRDLKRDDDAHDKYEHAARLNPQCANAWYCWGLILESKNCFAEAGEKYQMAAHLDPRNVAYWTQWGNVLYRVGKTRQARQKYAHIIKQWPKDAEIWNIWGIGLHNLGAFEEASQKSQHVMQLQVPIDAEVAQESLRLWSSSLGYWKRQIRSDDDLQAYKTSESAYRRFLFMYEWPPEKFIPMVEAALQGQRKLIAHLTWWPYWLRYRDYLLSKCDQYHGQVSTRIQKIIAQQERIKLPHTKFTIIL